MTLRVWSYSLAPLAPFVFPPGSPLNWPLDWDEEEEEEDGDDATAAADDNNSLEPRAKCQRIMKVLYSVLTFVF